MESYTERKREEIEGYLTLIDLWNMYCTCTVIVPVDLRPWLRESGYRLVTLSMTAVPSLPLLYLRTDKRLRYSYSSWTVCGRLTNFLVLYLKGRNQSLMCTGYSVEKSTAPCTDWTGLKVMAFSPMDAQQTKSWVWFFI